MKITALVENTSHCELKPKHGLSLYIETKQHKILFDLGPDKTLFENADKRKIDLSEVDTVIISHGHTDHGSGLEQFLRINHKAKVYVQRKAFEKHYAKVFLIKADIGLDPNLANHPQVMILDGKYKIDDELELFTVESDDDFFSSANSVLLTERRQDDFLHEQNLIIHGRKNVLVMGCGHKGIVNILENALSYKPEICVGGYHLFNPTTKKMVSTELLDRIAGELVKYNIRYYTCHCTGQEAYGYLADRVENMKYLSCGESICDNETDF